MFTSKLFFKRFILLAIIFNLPPVIASVSSSIGFEPILLILALGIWANVPLFAGLKYLFDNTDIMFGEFGMVHASPIVMFCIIIFWMVSAAVLARGSLFFSGRSQNV